MSAHATPSPTPQHGDGLRRTGGLSPAGQVGDAVALLCKEAFGKGPPRTRTRLVDDLLVCVLEDGLTTAERFLVGEGRSDLVAEGRRVLGDALQPRIVALVEQTLGRGVVSVSWTSTPAEDRDVVVILLAAAGTPRERSAALQERSRELVEEAHAVLAESEQARRHRRNGSSA